MATNAGREPAALECVYVVSGDASREAITSSLRALLRTRHHAIARHRFTMLDTFDGRVRRAGARLTRTGTDGICIVVWQPRDGRAPLTARLTEPVSFAWDLPHGPLQEALAPVIGVRRLLPQADAEEHGSELDILDDRRKTVARLRIESGHVRQPMARSAWHPLPTILTLTGLRGYDEAYERLKPIIASRPGISSCPDGLEGVIFQHAGVTDARGGPALRIDLAPGVPAEAGARGIHRAIVGILTANEPGLRANIDTEFLHDFRVALRRTRSLLRQLKHVFPSDSVEHFSTEFSWLGRLTGPPRDLDVLILSLRAQAADLPAGVRGGPTCYGPNVSAAVRSTALADGRGGVSMLIMPQHMVQHTQSSNPPPPTRGGRSAAARERAGASGGGMALSWASDVAGRPYP